MNFLTSIEPCQLKNMKYSIVGTGGFTKTLIEGLLALKITLPEVILSTSKGGVDDIYGITVIPLSEAEQRNLRSIVLGSDVHQVSLIKQVLNIANNVNNIIPIFYNIADFVVSRLANITSKVLLKNPRDKPYVVMITVSHSTCIDKWLNNFVEYLEKKGLDIVICHPLNQVKDSIFTEAEFVFTWTGITEIFSQIKEQLAKLSIKLTYAECGFFPQSQFFYFDKSGVNALSQLMNDSLAWVGEKELQSLDVYKKSVFGERERKNQGWIFVPLQIESDSNIQLFSNFTNGMQEYIDFICEQYPNQDIIFKAHPKDVYSTKYHCQFGRFSTEDTLDLIAGAKLVRGINSSVLFEAALFDKTVISDGHSLLNHECGNTDVVLAAMLARQFNVTDIVFSLDKLKKFSHFNSIYME